MRTPGPDRLEKSPALKNLGISSALSQRFSQLLLVFTVSCSWAKFPRKLEIRVQSGPFEEGYKVSLSRHTRTLINTARETHAHTRTHTHTHYVNVRGVIVAQATEIISSD